MLHEGSSVHLFFAASSVRILIDGYNLMHAKGLITPARDGRGLHHARRRFLDAVAAAVVPMDRPETTVVFDAAKPIEGRPRETTYKEMKVIYAVDDESADARLEAMIAAHAAPRTLTVVSSDRRVRRAAERRRAKVLDSDGFWSRQHRIEAPRPVEAPAPKPAPSDAEAAHWQVVFQEAEAALRDKDAAGTVGEAMITQEEIDRIAREVEREGI